MPSLKPTRDILSLSPLASGDGQKSSAFLDLEVLHFKGVLCHHVTISSSSYKDGPSFWFKNPPYSTMATSYPCNEFISKSVHILRCWDFSVSALSWGWAPFNPYQPARIVSISTFTFGCLSNYPTAKYTEHAQ